MCGDGHGGSDFAQSTHTHREQIIQFQFNKYFCLENVQTDQKSVEVIPTVVTTTQYIVKNQTIT